MKVYITFKQGQKNVSYSMNVKNKAEAMQAVKFANIGKIVARRLNAFYCEHGMFQIK